MKARRFVTVVAVLISVVAAITAVRAKDGDKDQAAASQTTIVNFGQPQLQTPDPAPVGAAVTHFLDPEEVTIQKGSSITFVVNGGGHGIAIHPVSKKTTRADIAEDLCDGNNNEEGKDRAADRRARAAVCNATLKNMVTVNDPATGNDVTTQVTGTENLKYTITDAKGDLIIDTGFNLTANNSNPVVLIANPRVDDPDHTARHFATSGAAPAGESKVTAGNPAGATVTGSNAAGAPGNRFQVRFEKVGRYLVICMQRTHSLNDHMFGFVNVVGDDDDKDQ